MSEENSKIIISIITIIGSIITTYLLPFIKAKTTQKQRENIYTLVNFAVKASEQIFCTECSGPKKKEYVLNYLNEKGIKMSQNDLEILIEAAVKELNITQKKTLK